jgi:hypothetical protein
MREIAALLISMEIFRLSRDRWGSECYVEAFHRHQTLFRFCLPLAILIAFAKYWILMRHMTC